MPYINDQHLTTREYRDLYRQWRQARTSTPFMKWAAHELSPAGARDRELRQRREQYEDQVKAAVWVGIHAQRQAMEAETDPRGDPEVAKLLELANERDIETGGYSTRALKAQHHLASPSIDLVTMLPE
jgi:hypothetical protein